MTNGDCSTLLITYLEYAEETACYKPVPESSSQTLTREFELSEMSEHGKVSKSKEGV